MNTKKTDDGAGWPAKAEPVYHSVAQSLAAVAHQHTASPSILVAYSGGLDSHLLLVAAQRWCRQINARLRAVYVDHGLQVRSAEWAVHCARVCEQLSVDFQSLSVTVELSSGESPEKAARDAR
ncbi:MAG: ATP-binding protein, partial [Pseudomonadota bacterium]